MRVFLSSTSKDLAAHRLAAADVVRDAQGQPVVMEHFPADPRPIVELCEAQMRGCDLVLLVQAHRRGWVPGVDQGGDGVSSITALELGIADRLGIDVLGFLADEDWPGRLWDSDDPSRDWTRRFRAGLNRNVRFFAWETDPRLVAFRALVSQELANNRLRAGRLPSAPVRGELTGAPLRHIALPPLPADPYPLLGPYEHPAVFGGRDADLARMVQLVLQPALVLCLHAASGTGKSSLLLAGLAPRLRSEGHAVSVDRAPGEAGLAQRLLRDLFEAPADLDLDDGAVAPMAFARWVTEACTRTGKPVVLVLDQIDDLLRNEASRAAGLARLGLLLAATSQRLPGRQVFACKWVLCYRHEFHGVVRAWLEDVLVQARAAGLAGIDNLPFDLSDAQRSHDWAVPPLGRLTPGDRDAGSARAAFLDAILKPLRLRTDSGGGLFRFTMTDADAQRLAACFARARLAQPDAPLVPELQVVLNHLLQKAESAAPSGAGSVPVVVPPDEALDDEVRDALANHLDRVLNALHPVGTDLAAAKLARARTLLALRQLADADGRRASGLPLDEFVRRLGAGGEKVLAGLSSAQARLVVTANGQCGLSHDRLAEVVSQRVRDEQSSGNLLLDQRLIDLQRVVSQKVGLFQADRQDESALTLSRPQAALLAEQQDLLLFDEGRRAWWSAGRALARRKLQRRMLLGGLTVAAAAGVLTLLVPPRVTTVRETLVIDDAAWTIRGQVAVSATPGQGVVRWAAGSAWPPRAQGAGRFEKLVVSPDAVHVAGITGDGSLHVWRAEDPGGSEGPPVLKAIMVKPIFARRNGAVEFSPDGRWLAAVRPDGGLHVWRVDRPSDAQIVRRMMALPMWGDRPQVPGMRFSADGRWLVVVERANAVFLHRTDGAEPPKALGQMPGDIDRGDESSQIAFSADGRWMAWERKADRVSQESSPGGAKKEAARGSVYEVRDLVEGRVTTLPYPELTGETSPFEHNMSGWFSRDSQWLIGRKPFEPFLVWRRQGQAFTGGQVAAGTERSSSDSSWPLQYSRDNAWVASLANDTRLHLWQPEHPPGLGDKPVFEERYMSAARPAVGFHPAGGRVAAVAPDGAVHEWRLGEAPDVNRRLTQVTGAAMLRYDDDGQFLWAMDDRHVAMGPVGRPMEDVIEQVKGLQCVMVLPDRSALLAFGRSSVVVARRMQTFWGLKLWPVKWPALSAPRCLAGDDD